MLTHKKRNTLMSCHTNINKGLVTVKETSHFGVLIVTVANGLLLFAVDFILSFTFFFFFFLCLCSADTSETDD